MNTTALLKPRTTFVYLMLLDGRCIATNHMGECGLSRHNQWNWVIEHITAAYECEPEDVTCEETDTGDYIAVNGLIVGYLDFQR